VAQRTRRREELTTEHTEITEKREQRLTAEDAKDAEERQRERGKRRSDTEAEQGWYKCVQTSESAHHRRKHELDSSLLSLLCVLRGLCGFILRVLCVCLCGLCVPSGYKQGRMRWTTS